MIITTVEELRLHLPNHAYDDLGSMDGAFRRSEADVLKEKIGHSLYSEMIRHYYAIDESDRSGWLIDDGFYEGKSGPWAELTFLCQQVVVFDAFMRQADINAISINQSGINVVSAENYDAASKDGISNYKKQLNKEMHAAVNRLLVWLEEAAIRVDSVLNSENSSSSGGGEAEFDELTDIVTLWKTSKFYYLHADLFVGTATLFNEYVDIYESREKFVQLLPDIKYCQHQYIENELGVPLAADLLTKKITGHLSQVEQQTVKLIQQALCLCVETRSQMFKRPESKDEAIGAVAQMNGYVRQHIKEYDKEAAQYYPLYDEAIIIAEARERNAVCTKPKPEPWVNNRPGNGMLVMPPVY